MKKVDPVPPALGTREDVHTEFKQVEKLRTIDGRRDLVRHVVAFRNLDGGVLWIGAIEKDECLVGWEALRADDVGHKSALRDKLLDSVEPPLRVGREIRYEQVSIAGVGNVLAIVVEPRPANAAWSCVRDGNKREFPRRLDGRIETIPYAELFATTRELKSLDGFKRDVESIHRQWIEQLGEVGGLALTVMVERDAVSGPIPTVPEHWKSILETPPPDLARPGGATWHAGPHGTVAIRESFARSGFGLKLQRGEQIYRRVEVGTEGRLQLCVGRPWLAWRGAFSEEPRDLPEAPLERLDARTLVESVVSSVRLASRLLAEIVDHARGAERHVGAVLSLHRMRSWIWPVGHPMAMHVFFRRYWFQVRSDPVSSDVLIRTVDALLDRPDSLALDLLRRIYESCASDENEQVQNDQIVWFDNDGSFRVPT